MKRFFISLLLIVMILGLTSVAYAASDESIEAANQLNALGLFNGTGTDANGNPIYDLDRAPTRHEAVVMLVRILGKEEEARNGTWDMPFTDVADWAKSSVGYAYANGLTGGTSATTFSGDNTITASQYLSFVLRALGYGGTDFRWDAAWELSDSIGLTSGEYNVNTKAFLRSDLVQISTSALKAYMKGSEITLFENMKENEILEQNVSLELATKPLQYYYCNDWGNTVHYENQYIQSTSVTKIGDRYQFEISLMPNHFEYAWLFPVGYKSLDNMDTHPDGYNIHISLESGESADVARFSIDEDYFFLNPINRQKIIFRLMPVATAFPDDFKFAEGCKENCIQIIFNTTQLPK